MYRYIMNNNLTGWEDSQNICLEDIYHIETKYASSKSMYSKNMEGSKIAPNSRSRAQSKNRYVFHVPKSKSAIKLNTTIKSVSSKKLYKMAINSLVNNNEERNRCLKLDQIEKKNGKNKYHYPLLKKSKRSAEIKNKFFKMSLIHEPSAIFEKLNLMKMHNSNRYESLDLCSFILQNKQKSKEKQKENRLGQHIKLRNKFQRAQSKLRVNALRIKGNSLNRNIFEPPCKQPSLQEVQNKVESHFSRYLRSSQFN